MDKALISGINQSLGTDLLFNLSGEELQARLTVHIEQLINHDFDKLVRSLYRIDVSEEQLRNLLEKTKGENAAALIAGLIIQRQREKIKNRRQTKPGSDIPEDEKW